MEYVRFRSRYPNVAGFQVGIFGLVNVLGRNGMLTPEQEHFRQVSNAWYNAAYPDPCTVDQDVYDRNHNPRAAAWFKSSATGLISRVSGYLAILDAHSVAWEEIRTADPGAILYEDDFQVVAIPARV